MGITLGAGASPGSSGTSTAPLSAALTCTSNRQIVGLFIWANPAATLSLPTLTGEAAPTLIGSPLTISGGFGMAQLCYMPNLTASGSKQLGATLSASSVWACSMVELQGGDPAAFYVGNELSISHDTSGGGDQPFADPITSAQGFTFTTVNANDAIVMAIYRAGGQFTGMAGLTHFNVDSLATGGDDGWYQLDAGAAGTKNFSGNQTAFGVYAIKGAVFKASTAAPVLTGSTLKSNRSSSSQVPGRGPLQVKGGRFRILDTFETTKNPIIFYSADISESIAASEASAATMSATAAIVESAATTEASSAAADFTATITESVAATEASAETGAFTATITESTAATEASASTASMSAAITESAAATEASSATLGGVTAIDAPPSAGRNRPGRGPFSLGRFYVRESIEVSGIPPAILLSAIVESVAATELSSATAASTAAIVESVAATESSAATGAFSATITESVAATTASTTGAFAAAIVESAAATEVSAVAGAFAAAITEPVAATEASAETGAASATITESAAASESSSASTPGNFLATITESASASDSAAETTAASAVVVEATAATEASAGAGSAASAIVETLAASTSQTVALAALAAIGETVSATTSSGSSTTGDYAAAIIEQAAATQSATGAASMSAGVIESIFAGDGTGLPLFAGIFESVAATDSTNASPTLPLVADVLVLIQRENRIYTPRV